MTKVLYHDGSTERFFYGTGANANLLVKKKDRRGVVTNYEYDAAGRRTHTVYAAATMDLADNETPVGDPSVPLEETCTYLLGTDLEQSCTRGGETTTYAYDYRHRVVSVAVQPQVGTTLTSTSTYIGNRPGLRPSAAPVTDVRAVGSGPRELRRSRKRSPCANPLDAEQGLPAAARIPPGRVDNEPCGTRKTRSSGCHSGYE